MDRDQAEAAWQKAVTKYKRSRGIDALKAMLREHEPPEPPDLVVHPETALWFKTLAPPPLSGLDQFTDPTRRQEITMQHQEATRVLAYIQETQDSRIAVNGRRLSPTQGAAVRDALTLYIESQAKEDTHEGERDIRGNGDALRRPGGRVVNAG
jgi:hypothetical protein